MREIASNQALSQAVADLTIARGEVSALIGDHVNYTLAPRPSGVDHGNQSRFDLKFGLKAGAVLFVAAEAVNALTGGPGRTKAQEPSLTPTASFLPDGSVAPSEDPITGVLPSCPPEASPSPTPLVEPTPPIIAVVNGNEFTLVDNTVTVRALAQDAPASPLASPLASEGPDLLGIDTDGDGDIDEDDGETAAVDCDPDGSPIPSAAPTEAPTPKPKYDVSLSGVDLLDSIIADNQDKKDIEKTSISDIENKIDDMWGKYKDAFSNVRGIDDVTVDKQYFKWWLKAMETGHHPNDTEKVIKSYTEQNIIDNRIRYSASSVIETLIVYQNTSDPDARFAIAELLDLERNYAVRGVNPAEWKKANTSFTNTVNNLVIVNKAQLPSSN